VIGSRQNASYYFELILPVACSSLPLLHLHILALSLLSPNHSLSHFLPRSSLETLPYNCVGARCERRRSRSGRGVLRDHVRAVHNHHRKDVGKVMHAFMSLFLLFPLTYSQIPLLLLLLLVLIRFFTTATNNRGLSPL
jgi:hypothetical protein